MADEHDQQDCERGQNTYSVTVNGGATVYGGVIGWTASGYVVSIAFLPQFAQELGIAEHIGLVLDQQGDDVSGVHQGLERILGPCN